MLNRSQTRPRIARIGTLHPDLSKVCRTCREIKPRSSFGNCPTNWDGYKHHCRACNVEVQRRWRQNNPEADKRKQREWRLRNPRSQRIKHTKRRYGIGEPEYQALYEHQEGACAICRTPSADPWNMQIDHCHITGKVRGLLCHKCNKGIGLLGDDPARVAAALNYLEGTK